MTDTHLASASPKFPVLENEETKGFNSARKRNLLGKEEDRPCKTANYAQPIFSIFKNCIVCGRQLQSRDSDSLKNWDSSAPFPKVPQGSSGCQAGSATLPSRDKKLAPPLMLEHPLFSMVRCRAFKEFTVNKLSLGYIYDFTKLHRIKLGVGGMGTAHLLPASLHASYGETPLSFLLFLRAKL